MVITLQDLNLSPSRMDYFTRKTKPKKAEFTGMGIEGNDISKLPVGFQTKTALESLHTGITDGTAEGAKKYVEFYTKSDRFTPTEVANFFLDNDYVKLKKGKGTDEIPPNTELELSKVDNGNKAFAGLVLEKLGFKTTA